MYRQELQLCDKTVQVVIQIIAVLLKKKYKFEMKIKYEMKIKAKEYHKAKIALLHGT